MMNYKKTKTIKMQSAIQKYNVVIQQNNNRETLLKNKHNFETRKENVYIYTYL